MFYSHEVLTDRKHGVATVWLVATLGSKSALKKVTRKAILNVDVPKACGTVTEPAIPMALRLQGSLLYGISRVFSQQCGYMLNDIQSLRDKMQCISLLVKEIETDPDVANTRPEQLNICEDPAFDIELDIGLDLSTFRPVDTASRCLSSHIPISSHSCDTATKKPHQHDSFQTRADEIDGSSFIFDDGGELDVTINITGGDLDAFENETNQEQGIVHHPDFEISEDGSLRMFTSNMPSDISAAHTGFEQEAAGNCSKNSGLSEQVRADHEVGLIKHHESGEDYSVCVKDLEDPVLPSAEPFSPAQVTTDNNFHEHVQAAGLSSFEAVEGTILSAEAPHRQALRTKFAEPDYLTELGNRKLSEWSNDYATNMKNFRDAMTRKVSLAQAKRNASFWVLDQGIGGVLSNFGSDIVSHPFETFSGQILLDTLIGRTRSPFSKKRSYVDIQKTPEEQHGGRRVRSRIEEDEIGRGNRHDELDTEQVPIVPGEDYMLESEVGRQAPSIRDHSSGMPWNLSSRQGSLFPYENMLFAASSSADRLSGAETDPPSSIHRRRQRMTSASPLLGKGRLPSWLGSMESLNINDPEENEEIGFTNLDAELAGDLDEAFELYGPAAGVSTQQAISSQWLAMTLENEARNFLSFVIAAVREKASRSVNLSTRLQDDSTTFKELLDPKVNSNIVAAQGFLHTLALATKSLIRVDQSEAYGDITMKVVVEQVRSFFGEGESQHEEDN